MKRLQELSWKAFDIHHVFPEIQRGKRLKTDDHILGNMAYVSSSAMNNGVDNFVSNSNGVRIFGNCLTLANSGSVGTSFYHPYRFVASDHVTKLQNFSFSKYVYLFIATISNRLSEKYSFNREINDKRLSREKIMLPANDNGEPDYEYMEAYMKEVEKCLLSRYKAFLDNKNAKTTIGGKSLKIRWRTFVLNEIFEIRATNSSIDRNRLNGLKGDIPYITRTDKNNGWDSLIAKQTRYGIDNGNVITVGLDTQTAFYQPISFYTGQNIQIFTNKNLNKYVASFIIPLLKKQMEKFNWGGNGATLGRLRRQKIMLPVDVNGNPDYAYMERFMMEKETSILNEYISRRLTEK
ncbi:MAG: restriction endonuclease subunit S [Prevotella sp.]|nr:restriction endonuclease subunit S [Prevotella sp.]